MASIATVVTRGFSTGSVNLVVTRGYGAGTTPGHAFPCGTWDPLAFDTDCTASAGGGTSKRDKKLKRTIRFSDLDYRERLEALKDLPVKPFSELEKAAAQLAAADEDEQEDDEAVLLAIMKVLIH